MRAERRGAAVAVSVRDNGVGIRSDVLEHVFDPFVPSAPTTARRASLGIGLTLARSIAVLHGGTIEARSAGLGKGSEFTVRLPLLETAAQSAARAPSPTAPRWR